MLSEEEKSALLSAAAVGQLSYGLAIRDLDGKP